jgi:hypothetical protein
MAWEEMILSLVLSWVEKGTKLPELRLSENKHFANFETKKAPSWDEKGTKSLPKKLHYLIVILSMSGVPISVDELMEIFTYRNKTKFRDSYMKPLESVGFIAKTNPAKPTSSNQKYYITEAGKLFLSGQNMN